MRILSTVNNVSNNYLELLEIMSGKNDLWLRQHDCLDIISSQLRIPDTQNTIAMTAMIESSSLAAMPLDFVRVLETQGLVYIEKRVRAAVVIPQLLAVVWPIFLTLLISAGYAAALIWLLVRTLCLCVFTYCRSEHTDHFTPTS